MVLIQVKLTEKQDEAISIYKIKHRLKTKSQAIAKIIDECGAENENSTQANILSDRRRT